VVTPAPRFSSLPPCVSSLGADAVAFARRVGIELDEWQAQVLEGWLGRRADGKWAAFEAALVTPRQNGKSEILLTRALYGLFVLGERTVVFSAHQWDSALEMFRRMLDVVEQNDELQARVKKIRYSAANEGIELDTGERIRFRTRSRAGARGFAADLVVFDEAAFLPEAVQGALLPTLRARSAESTAQVLYAAAAVDQLSNADGVVLARLRERGIRGDDASLAYFEWSAAQFDEEGRELPIELVPDEVLEDPAIWRAANPALPARIAEENVRNELRALNRRSFAVECLGIGDWPQTAGDARTPISVDDWLMLVDAKSKPVAPICVAFDVSPDRRASVAIAGRRLDGLLHVEVPDARDGTGWLVERVAQLIVDHDPWVVVADATGPGAALVERVEERAGVAVTKVSASEHAQACGLLLDAVTEGTLRHLGSAELIAALKGASTRPLGDAWAWSRKSSAVDISPLVAATLALWAVAGMPADMDDPVIY
jgi:hypothetical protein